jgi:ion channel POLLUX/CASTOR
MQVPFLSRLRYHFENSLSKGSGSVILWLGGFTFFFLIITTFVIIFFENISSEEPMGFVQAFYEGFYQLLSPGVIDWEMASHFRWLMAILCLVGLLIVSILIGLVSSTIESKIEDLKRGRTVIQEKNHIAIYGWNSKIFLILNELILANSNQKKSCIAIMANMDKVEMESEIRDKIENFRNTKIIVRSGLITDVDDVNILLPQEARSIMVLPSDDEDSDMHSIKTLMALVNNPRRNKKNYHIVTELNNNSNMEVAEIVGKNEVSIVQTTETISRIMVQTCRQPGLSNVYNELLGFDGNEIYFLNQTNMQGKTFAEAGLWFPNACLIGLRQPDGKLLLNPDPSTILSGSEKLICIAEDDHALKMVDPAGTVSESSVYKGNASLPEKDKTLLLGWNNKARIILSELNKYVVPGSELHIVSSFEEFREEAELLIPELQNLSCSYKTGDTTNAELLKSLELEKFDHIIVLSYSNIDYKHVDSWTLVTLIQLRELANRLNLKFNIVSEMMDIRNKALAELAKPDDFIISDNITSMILSQLSENAELLHIYKDLFSAEGAEIYLKPASDFVVLNTEVNFYTVCKSAALRKEVAIGYRKTKMGENSGIVINPEKSSKVHFTAEDRVIVISG